MRQVTGSNQLLENKKVSIQVTLGGRSFSVDKIAVANDAEAVEFVIDTPRVTLAPREAVSLDNAAELLRLAGKPCRLISGKIRNPEIRRHRACKHGQQRHVRQCGRNHLRFGKQV